MSTPPNPLDSFRNSSYFHVLFVCDSAQTAGEISGNSGTILTQHIIRDPNLPLTVQTTGQGGQYVILIDGSTDAQFVIQSANWETIMASNLVTTNGPITSSCAYCEGELIIHEPYGVRFLDVMSSTCDVLSTDPSGLSFVLKTYFVGFNDDFGNGPSQQVLTNIRPFWFTMTDLQAQFSETGAVYNLQFVGSNNGISKMPMINALASSTTVTNYTVDNSQVSTLRDIFEKVLPAKIQGIYNKQIDAYRIQCQQQNITFDPSKTRPLRVEFKLDPNYGSDCKFGSNLQQNKNDKPGIRILSFSNKTSFEQIITEVMKSSKEVMDDANNADTKKLFKVISVCNSTPTEYLVTFYINQYQVVCQNQGSINVNPFPPPNSSIEFDYIFTGKNVDILEFDMKLELGLAFFQTLGTSKNIASQQQSLQGIPSGQASASVPARGYVIRNSTSNVVRTKTPMGLGNKVSNPTNRNNNSPINTTNFMSAMQRQAALESVQARIVIRGNTQLLNELSTLPVDFDNIFNGNNVQSGSTTGIATNWMKVPVYVKINIMTPALTGSLNFAEKFWYQGYYQVLSVKNIFEGGEFKQELELLSLMQTDGFNTIGDNLSTQPVNVSQTQGSSQSTNPSSNGITRSVSQVQTDLNAQRSDLTGLQVVI